jgi:hypothetical protein
MEVDKTLATEEDGYTTDKTTVPEPEEPTISQDKTEPEPTVITAGSFVSNKSTEENNTEEGKASLEEDATETSAQPENEEQNNRFTDIQQ